MRRRSLPFLIALLFSLSFAAPSFAEPSRPVTALMNDSVSLLDWGLYRAEESFADFAITDIPTAVRFGYQNELNRIVVAIHSRDFILFTDKNAARDYLSEGIQQVKGRLGVDPTSGRPFDDWYPNLFNHNGFHHAQEPGIPAEIGRITVLRAKAFFQTKEGRALMECTSDLLANKSFCSE